MNDSSRTAPSGHAYAAKDLLQSRFSGTLSTHSSHQQGFPFGSMMPYALDQEEKPIFLISRLAMHTRNIIKNPKASLFVTGQADENNQLSTARVTCMGELLAVDNDETRACYLKAHPDAQQWVDFADFSFYRMEISAIYFVAGFGKMGWVDLAEYRSLPEDS